MKGLKKLLTGILAATLIMGSSLTVCADENTNTDTAPATTAADTSATITITPKATTVNEIKKGTVDTITYTYYQVLRATAPKGEVTKDTAISYYLDQSTDGAMKALLAGDDGIFDAKDTADGSKWIMTIKKKADGTAYTGEEVRDFLNNQKIKDAALNGKPNTFVYDSSTGKAKSGTLPIGYYLIESSLGSVVALDTVGHVDIEEKNDYITTTKTVAKTNYKVGDNVEYTATVFIPTSTKVGSDVILHDKMEARKLKYNKDASAKIGENAFGGFTVEVATEEKPFEDGCTFEITIPVDANLLGQTIEFKYTAELLGDAADKDGFVNELFGESNGYKTEPSKPVVYTYDFNVDKEFLGAEEGTENFTADFEIRTAPKDAKTAIKFVQVGDALNYRKAHSGDTNTTTTVTVNKNDVSNFYGLDAGTYYLVEKDTNAPGYNILTVPVAVTITANEDPKTATVSYTVNDKEYHPDDAKTVKIQNTKGTMLPSTGGIGTTIFYIIGSLLIVAGVAYFIVRRKANAE